MFSARVRFSFVLFYMWVCLQFSAGSDYPLFSLSARQLNMVSHLGEASGFLWSGCLSSCLWSCLFQAMCSYHSDQMSHTIAWPRSCLVGFPLVQGFAHALSQHGLVWLDIKFHGEVLTQPGWQCGHSQVCQPAPNKPSSIPIILYFQNAASLNFGSPVTAQKPNIGSILFMSASERDLCVYSAHCLTIATEYWKSVPCTPSQTFMFGPNTNFCVSTELCSAVFRKHIQDTLHCICVSPIA